MEMTFVPGDFEGLSEDVDGVGGFSSIMVAEHGW